MPKRLKILGLFLAIFPLCHGTTAKEYFSMKGKVAYTIKNGNPDQEFIRAYMAFVMNNYLKESLSEDDYADFPYVYLRFQYDSYTNGMVGLEDSTLHINLYCSQNFGANALKLLAYSVKEIQKNQKKARIKKVDTSLDILDFDEDDGLPEVLLKPLSKHLQHYLHAPIYRRYENEITYLSLPPKDVFYYIQNDTFKIDLENGKTLKTNCIYSRLKTPSGSFIFDSDTSFYFLKYKVEPHYVDYQRVLSIIDKEISKKHIIQGIYPEALYIENKNKADQLIYLTYRHSYKKFLYFVDEDLFIPDYEKLEQKFIEDLKSSYSGEH